MADAGRELPAFELLLLAGGVGQDQFILGRLRGGQQPEGAEAADGEQTERQPRFPDGHGWYLQDAKSKAAFAGHCFPRVEFLSYDLYLVDETNCLRQ